MKNRKNVKNECVKIAFTTLLFSIPALIGCGVAARDATENNPANLYTVIITEADKTAAVEIPAVQNHERNNALGPSIPSGAHSDAFPGIVFIWDSKAAGNGYLIVTAEVFDKFESFTLTTKEGPGYWDFVIKPEADQQKNKDGNYVFFIPRASGSNKINKVFVSEWLEKDEEPGEPEDATIIEVDAELVELTTWFFTSGVPNNCIKMIYPDENAVFYCTVDNGYIDIRQPGSLKNMSVHSGNTIYYWHGIGLVSNAFIEILLKSEENLIGYALIKVNSRNAVSHEAVLLKSVLFPQINGKYQKVSEEYVKAAIEKVKDEVDAINALPLPIEVDAELVGVREDFSWSSAYTVIISMVYSDENVVSMCNVDNGVFYNVYSTSEERFYTKNVNAHSGDKFLWVSQERLLNNWEWVFQAFTEIILKLDQNIVGYAVIDINVGAGVRNGSVILKSVLFPQIDGKYQKVSEEYVKAAIEKVKAERKGGDAL